MLNEYPVLGGFISDDYQFYFEESAIEALAIGKSVKGAFVCYSNEISGLLLPMKLIVFVKKIKKELSRTGVDISFRDKKAVFKIAEIDFNEWLKNPSDWVRENGPSARIGMANLYISRDFSKKGKDMKKALNNFIYMSKH